MLRLGTERVLVPTTDDRIFTLARSSVSTSTQRETCSSLHSHRTTPVSTGSIDQHCDWCPTTVKHQRTSQYADRYLGGRSNSSVDWSFVFLEYEQKIVAWADDSLVSVCFSCTKPFGFSRRKHHCRLDGFVVCNPCSHFLLFSVARKSCSFC